jgi:hypothetical protein
MGFMDGGESSWGEDNYSSNNSNSNSSYDWGSFSLGGLFDSTPTTTSWSNDSFNNAINNIGKVDNSVLGVSYTGPTKVANNPNANSYGWGDFALDAGGLLLSAATGYNPLVGAGYSAVRSLYDGANTKQVLNSALGGFTSRGTNNYGNITRGIGSNIGGTAGDVFTGISRALPGGDISKIAMSTAQSVLNGSGNKYGTYNVPGYAGGTLDSTGRIRSSNTMVDGNGNSFGNVAGTYRDTGNGDSTASTLLRLGNQYLQYKQAKKAAKERAYAVQHSPQAEYNRAEIALANKQANNNAEFARKSLAEQKLNNRRNYEIALENNRRQALRYNNAIREKARYANLLMGNSNSAYAINNTVSRTPYSMY